MGANISRTYAAKGLDGLRASFKQRRQLMELPPPLSPIVAVNLSTPHEKVMQGEAPRSSEQVNAGSRVHSVAASSLTRPPLGAAPAFQSVPDPFSPRSRYPALGPIFEDGISFEEYDLQAAAHLQAINEATEAKAEAVRLRRELSAVTALQQQHQGTSESK